MEQRLRLGVESTETHRRRKSVDPPPEVDAVAVNVEGGALVDLKDLNGNLRNQVIKDCVGFALTRSPNNSRVLTGR